MLNPCQAISILSPKTNVARAKQITPPIGVLGEPDPFRTKTNIFIARLLMSKDDSVESTTIPKSYTKLIFFTNTPIIAIAHYGVVVAFDY